jgi:hypothetical protein
MDALEILPAAGTAIARSSESPGLLVFGNNRIVLPPWDQWIESFPAMTIQNVAEAATERIFNGRWFEAMASLDQVKSPANIEALRRFSLYADEYDGWGIARYANELVSTTCDAASGAAQSDPRQLNLTSTAEIEWLGGAGVELRIGPNQYREYEHAKVISVSSGNYVILDGHLTYDYASGDPVYSAGYLPSASKMAPEPAQAESRDGTSLVLNARQTL